MFIVVIRYLLVLYIGVVKNKFGMFVIWLIVNCLFSFFSIVFFMYGCMFDCMLMNELV